MMVLKRLFAETLDFVFSVCFSAIAPLLTSMALAVPLALTEKDATTYKTLVLVMVVLGISSFIISMIGFQFFFLQKYSATIGYKLFDIKVIQSKKSKRKMMFNNFLRSTLRLITYPLYVIFALLFVNVYIILANDGEKDIVDLILRSKVNKIAR